MYGVIDIGSNTIRMVIYKTENGEIKAVLNKKTVAGLVGYVNKKNNLSEKGINRVVEVLSEYKDVTDSIMIDGVYVFATAIFRNIGNKDDVLAIIKEKCGFDVKILSGYEEANFGYEGTVKTIKLENGILADIGGGSTELVFYKDGLAVHSCSMPIGSLNLYTGYVGKILPKRAELEEMKKAVKKEIKKLELPKIGFVPTTLCAVGGTARTAHKLVEKFSEDSVYGSYQCKKLKEIIKSSQTYAKGFITALIKIAPERIHTIIPGMVIMFTIAKYFELENVVTSTYGVREGFLYNILKEKIINE